MFGVAPICMRASSDERCQAGNSLFSLASALSIRVPIVEWFFSSGGSGCRSRGAFFLKPGTSGGGGRGGVDGTHPLSSNVAVICQDPLFFFSRVETRESFPEAGTGCLRHKNDISLRRISDLMQNHCGHPVREETQEGESPSILLRKLHARALPPSPPFRHRERRILCVVRIVLLSIL